MINTYKLNFSPPFSFKVVFNSPHSGCIYDKEFLDSTNLETNDLRSSEDSFVVNYLIQQNFLTVY